MEPNEIIRIASEAVKSEMMEIVGWTIATVTPVVTGLVVALGILWSSLGKKNEEIKRLNTLLLETQKVQLKEYNDTLKELAPFFEKSADVQSRVYDICSKIKDIVSNIDNSDDITELLSIATKDQESLSEIIKKLDAINET